jgi:hypothetical protein
LVESLNINHFPEHSDIKEIKAKWQYITVGLTPQNENNKLLYKNLAKTKSIQTCTEDRPVCNLTVYLPAKITLMARIWDRMRVVSGV